MHIGANLNLEPCATYAALKVLQQLTGYSFKITTLNPKP